MIMSKQLSIYEMIINILIAFISQFPIDYAASLNAHTLVLNLFISIFSTHSYWAN